MKTKIQIKTVFGNIIFEHEKENNTIIETVKEYIMQELKEGLRYANLRYADLSSAVLRSADLRYADLSDVKHNECTGFLLPQCPSEGSFIAWKKAGGKIVKLLITDDAKRSSATTLKCRCSKAKVLGIENLDGTDSGLTEIKSNHDESFIYRVGEIVEVDNFDEKRFNECSTGIHFFIARESAVAYQ